jgi:cysteine desulfurase
MRRIYLDNATTTRPDPRVRSAMLPYLGRDFGSPSASHSRGRTARKAIEAARASVARLIDAPSEEILFTSSATEANNLALKGLTLASPPGRLLAAATEHISVLHPLQRLARSGHELVLLPVDGSGRIDLDRLRKEFARGAALLTMAHASAEIGTLQPLAEVARLAHAAGVPFHCDATASAGLGRPIGGVDGPDLLTLTPHLFHGPQGVAALRVRAGMRLLPLIEGGGQEGGLRAGTEPLASVVGFGVAADLAMREGASRAATAAERARELRDRIEAALPGLRLTGDPVDRLPGHLSLCVADVDAEAMLRALDDAGIEAASGSACATIVGKPSHVLEALGIEARLARGALTFMFGPGNRDDDASRTALVLGRAVKRLRTLSPFVSPA